MEAAPRPKLEELSDLPLEESLEAAAPVPPAAAIPEVAAGEAEAKAASQDPELTGLNFIDPALFQVPSEAPAAAPPLSAAALAVHEAQTELTLEDPVVDELLMSRAPPPRTAPRVPATATAPPMVAPTPAEPLPAPSAQAAATRVPIARTPSLSAAAKKVAAASAVRRPAPPLVPTPAAAGAPVAPPAGLATTHTAPVATKPAPTPPAAGAQPGPHTTQVPRVEAPSLVSWASARAASASLHKPATAPLAAPSAAPVPPPMASAAATAAPLPPPIANAFAATVPPPLHFASAPAVAAQVPSAAPTPKSAAPKTPAPAPTPAVVSPPPMDRDFIARNQVVERYLSGRLPLKGATDFERFCHDHPELLDEIGLPERVNAGLRLLEASGKPEPWDEAARPLWQRPQVTLWLAGAMLAMAVALGLVVNGSAAKTHRIMNLQKQVFERALDPATSTREIRLLPSRSGASNTPAITIGGGEVLLAEFKIDESRSPFHVFRVTIDRIDQGRVAVINNLAKDNNGHLRIALNSSALGPGDYQLTIEGLGPRGEPQPDSWVTIGVQR